MPKITFVSSDGRKYAVVAQAGQSLMQAAVDNLVPGILADCGGSCNCATCHVYIATEWKDRLPSITVDEASLLEGVVDPTPESRLSCQVTVANDLDGMSVRVPAAQY